MPIALFRVDERLIHGQVTVGWGNVTRAEHYLVVDDELARSEWESELYRLGVPEGVRASFLTVEEARRALGALKNAREVTVLLTRSLPAMASLARGGGLAGEKVNLGGMHHAPGRTRVTPYLHLGAGDVTAIREMTDAGAFVSARDLPSAPATGIDRLLDAET